MALFSRKSPDATDAAKATGAAAGTVTDVFEPPASAAVSDLTGDYVIDAAHTRIGFAVKHAMVTTVRGQFKEFAGTAHLETANPAVSSVELTIQVVSVDTGQQQRDEHLRTADFFEAEKFPNMTFRSTAVKQLDDESFTVTGDLTIKDVTRPVDIDFTLNGSAIDPYGNQRVGFEGATTISRSDFGLSWNAALETGGVMVSDKVKLDFDVSAIKQVPATV